PSGLSASGRVERALAEFPLAPLWSRRPSLVPPCLRPPWPGPAWLDPPCFHRPWGRRLWSARSWERLCLAPTSLRSPWAGPLWARLLSLHRLSVDHSWLGLTSARRALLISPRQLWL